jgi:hypothetical protein
MGWSATSASKQPMYESPAEEEVPPGQMYECIFPNSGPTR